MAVKYFCDVCEKEIPLEQIRLLLLSQLPGEKHGTWKAHVCKDCTEKVLSSLKQFRTTYTLTLEVPIEGEYKPDPTAKYRETEVGKKRRAKILQKKVKNENKH